MPLSYSLTVTDQNNCTASSTIPVTNYGLPTIVATPTKATVCSGETTSVTASGGATSKYVWNTSAITDAITVNPTINPTNYYVTGTDANGCTNSGSTFITVNPIPTVIATASKGTICLKDPVTISASGATSYAWSSTTPAVTGASSTITPTGTTSYIVTGTQAGCYGTASVSVLVNALPTVTGVAPTVCSGQPAKLVGQGASTYVWKVQ